MSWSCAPLESAEPHALGVTYWFDAAPTGDPYPMSVRFTGRRTSGPVGSAAGNAFDLVQTIPQVTPGTGRIAVTARVPKVAPGEWSVTATPVPDRSASAAPLRLSLPAGAATGSTGFMPVVNIRAPGVRLAAWPSLVVLGFMLGVAVQLLAASARGLPTGRLLAVSIVASLVGLVGAKVYYLLTHRMEKAGALTAGMSIQGFVIAAISVLMLGSWWAGLSIGQVLDVSAPGLLLGQAIGRLGCFFGGCCVGRPTASRWGVWSSDRRLGVRRIPVQLLESGVAWVLAAATLLAVLGIDPAVDGTLFLAGFGLYTFARQLLFPLRAVPRKTSHGTVAVLLVSGLVVAAAVGTLVLGG